MATVIQAFSNEPYGPGECRTCRNPLDGSNKTYCKKCAIIETRKWQQANPDKVKGWLQDNPETRRKIYRKWQLKAYYGLTVEQYDVMFNAQGGRCAGCGDLFKDTPNVDHNHETGEVRGLLCTACNRAIGFCYEDPQRLRLLAEYIERFN